MPRGDKTAETDEVRRSPLVAYGLAVVFVVAATGIGRELQLALGTSGGHPYLLQLMAIMVSAWIGGIGPGLVASVLGTLSIVFYSLEPTRSLHVDRLGDAVVLAIFIGCGIVVSTLAEWVHAGRRREERLRRGRESLLAIVAHDLRNPLSSILFASRAIRKHPDDASERLDMIERAASRMDSLIRDLVDASVFDRQGNLSMIIADESVPSIVADAVVSVTARAAAKSIRITTDVAQNVPLIRCDGMRVLQVLSNLLDNAVKFTPEGGRITVRQLLRMTPFGSRCRTPGLESSPNIGWTCSGGTGPVSPRVPAPASGSTSRKASCERTAADSGFTANRATERASSRRFRRPPERALDRMNRRNAFTCRNGVRSLRYFFRDVNP